MKRLRSLWNARRLDRDLDEELRAHLELATRARVESGEAEGDARFGAQRELGNTLLIKEDSRRAWHWTALENAAADLRYGWRAISKQRASSAAVVLSLGLGIGANTAIFSLTYAVLLKSLPVPNPGELIRYTFRNGQMDLGLSGPAFDSLRRHQKTSTDLMAWSDVELAVRREAETARAKGAVMSGNGFQVLRLTPALGRFFTDRDDQTGGGPEGYLAVLGYDYWRRRFGGLKSVLGTTLNINGASVTVAGVLPQGFDGVVAGGRVDVVLPLAFESVLHAPESYRHAPGWLWLTIMGRLKPGETAASAERELRAQEAAIRKEADPGGRILQGFFKPFRMGVAPARNGRSLLQTLYERPLLVLELLALALLALCCANTALLVLGRLAGRTHEFAVRSAMGAERGRIARQVLCEIVMLAVPGLGLAIFGGWALARTLVQMLGGLGDAPPLPIDPNGPILGFAAAVTALSAIGAGMIPALRASQADPANALRQRGGARISKRIGMWIVPAQVGVSVVMVAAAILLGSTFLNLYTQRSGFQASGGFLADIDLRPAKLNDAQVRVSIERLVAAMREEPGVEAAGAMSIPPLHDWWAVGHYFSRGRAGAVHTDMLTWGESVTPGTLEALGTRVQRGRGFRVSDRGTDRFCLLSESAARYFFPDETALDRTVYAAGDSGPDAATKTSGTGCRVIGVVEDAYFRSLREAPPRMLYTLMGDGDEIGPQFAVAVRARSSSIAAQAVKDAMRRVTPAAPMPSVFTMGEVMGAHLRRERMLIRLSVSFAGVALVLTGIGLFGLLMRTVSAATQEIGIRMALGATNGSVVRLVLRRSLTQVAVGLAGGTIAAIAVGHAMRSLLYGAAGAEPWVYVSSVAVIVLTGSVVALTPARRAVSVDPVQALRAE